VSVAINADVAVNELQSNNDQCNEDCNKILHYVTYATMDDCFQCLQTQSADSISQRLPAAIDDFATVRSFMRLIERVDFSEHLVY